MKRVGFGLLWFLVLWIGGGAIGGAIYASFTPSSHVARPAADFQAAYADGKAAGLEFAHRYRGVIFVGALLISIAGTAAGVLPGTRKKDGTE